MGTALPLLGGNLGAHVFLNTALNIMGKDEIGFVLLSDGELACRLPSVTFPSDALGQHLVRSQGGRRAWAACSGMSWPHRPVGLDHLILLPAFVLLALSSAIGSGPTWSQALGDYKPTE